MTRVRSTVDLTVYFVQNHRKSGLVPSCELHQFDPGSGHQYPCEFQRDTVPIPQFRKSPAIPQTPLRRLNELPLPVAHMLPCHPRVFHHGLTARSKPRTHTVVKLQKIFRFLTTSGTLTVQHD
jgi:hypothetical protein